MIAVESDSQLTFPRLLADAYSLRTRNTLEWRRRIPRRIAVPTYPTLTGRSPARRVGV